MPGRMCCGRPKSVNRIVCPLAKENCKATLNLFLLLQLTEKIKLKIWQSQSNVVKNTQLSKFYLTQWQRRDSFYFLYMIILFKFEVVILKIMYNMSNSNINLTLKLPVSLTLTSILLCTHNNEKQFFNALKSSLKLTASCNNGPEC